MTIDEVIKYYGGEMMAAASLGVSHQTIKNWKDSGIPKIRQSDIQLKSNNKLKADKK